MRSMTGFGKGRVESDVRTVEVEVRTVNNRFLKTSLKLPRSLAPLESEVEAAVRSFVTRGSVTVLVRREERQPPPGYRIDDNQARALIDAAETLGESTGLTRIKDIASVLSLPGVVVPVEGTEDVTDDCRRDVHEAARMALVGLTSMRDEEGERLRNELETIAGRIAGRCDKVEERAPNVVRDHRDRLHRRVNELVADMSDKVVVAEADLLREVALFADRADISEELQRLRSHLAKFKTVLHEDGEVGRKLEFLLQELLRETNTAGSKSNDYELTEHVVEIKADLERLREQVQNIE